MALLKVYIICGYSQVEQILQTLSSISMPTSRHDSQTNNTLQVSEQISFLLQSSLYTIHLIMPRGKLLLEKNVDSHKTFLLTDNIFVCFSLPEENKKTAYYFSIHGFEVVKFI